ncbi:MAG: glycosyltransferase [Planctomycetes bacterium]|nr:glycosyltransferase [Planctomycetota bacterium]
MKRFSICHFITELQPAGAERCVYELALRLDKRRFDIHVAALRAGAVAGWLEGKSIDVMVLNLRNRFDLPALFRLVKFLRDREVHLLHTHLFHADLVGRIAARLAGVPHLVHTVHVAERRFRPWQYAWARIASKWCERIICVSKAVRDHHASRTHLPSNMYQVIYNGIDTNQYRPDSQSRERFRERLQIEKDELLISFVGRLDYQKNPQMFLKAVEIVRKRHGNIKVAIAGDGPEARAVERFLREGNNAQWATWLGFTDEVPALLNASDIFVLPSRWEGFGLSAAEAMATGLPVIATRVPGLTELILDGKTGLLIESEDVEALILAIEKLIGDEAMRVSLGSAARQWVQEKFSIDMSIVAHERLYDEILRAK